MYQIIVKKEDNKKKEMIGKIKEMLMDSFLGEEWEVELDFTRMYNNAELEVAYEKAKKNMGHLTKEEVSVVLNLTMDTEKMIEDGIDFLIGRKALLGQLKLQQNPKPERKNTELFLQYMINELTMEIYEKITEYEDAEWIFLQQTFLREMAALVWLKVCIEQQKEPEQTFWVLKIVFPNREIDRTMVKQLLKKVDNLEMFLGSLWIEQADVFDKICCWENEDVNVVLLGRRFVEKAIRRIMLIEHESEPL